MRTAETAGRLRESGDADHSRRRLFRRERWRAHSPSSRTEMSSSSAVKTIRVIGIVLYVEAAERRTLAGSSKPASWTRPHESKKSGEPRRRWNDKVTINSASSVLGGSRRPHLTTNSALGPRSCSNGRRRAKGRVDRGQWSRDADRADLDGASGSTGQREQGTPSRWAPSAGP